MRPNYVFDQEEFYIHLDKVRRHKKVSWNRVSRETGVERSTLVRLGQGSSVSLDALGTLIKWADLDWNLFFKSREIEPTSLTQIAYRIEVDPRFKKELETASLALSKIYNSYIKGNEG